MAEYQTRLPDKNLLQAKLHEFYQLAESQAEASASTAEIVPQPAAQLQASKKQPTAVKKNPKRGQKK